MPDSALYYHEKFYEKDRIYNLDAKMLKVAELDAKFALVNEEIKKKAIAAEPQSERKINLLMVIFGIIMAALLAVLGYFLTKLRKNNRTIHKKQVEIKEKNQSLRKKIAENEFLSKELNHRVKNNLAMIQSLIQFRISEAETESSKKRLLDLYQRINSISIAHNYYSFGDSYQSLINLKDYLHRILNSVIMQHHTEVDLQENIEKIEINPDIALYIGLLVNELAVNALKHAKPKSGDKLMLSVVVQQATEDILLRFWDNGQEFAETSNQTSTGAILLSGMISQLEATCKRTGSAYEINIPVPLESSENLNFAV